MVTLDDDVDDVVLKLNVDKAGLVTAGMIQASAGSEVMDEDHHLFTLQEDRSLGMELYVNKGRGFVLASAHEIPGMEGWTNWWTWFGSIRSTIRSGGPIFLSKRHE